MSPSVGIVVPAYRPDVSTLRAFVSALEDHLDPSTIRIELDAAEEETIDALSTMPVTINAVAHRRGKGAAITQGFEALDTDVLAFADADGSTPAESVAAVVASVRGGRADVGVGSRRHPDADVVAHQSIARRWLGDGFAWLARRFLDVSLYDYQCGAKAISREAWQRVRTDLYEPGFAWDVELVAMAATRDLRIEEVPVTWLDDPASTVPPVRTAVAFARTLVLVRRRARSTSDRGGDARERKYRAGRQPLVDQFVETSDD